MNVTDKLGLTNADKRTCANTLVRALIADYDNTPTIVGLIEIGCELETRGLDNDDKAAYEASVELHRAYKARVDETAETMWGYYHYAFQVLGIGATDLSDLIEAAYEDIAETDAYQGGAFPSQLARHPRKRED